MSFLDLVFHKKEKTVHIADDLWLAEGETLNIYGAPLSGKTTACLSIVKEFAKSDKQIAYVATEKLDGKYMEKLKSYDNNNINFIQTYNIKHLTEMVKQLNVALVVVDSLTAFTYIDVEKDLEELLKTVENKRINAIIVSQGKNYGDKEGYEHKRLLDFYSYRCKIENQNGHLVLNNKTVLEINEVWI